MAAYYSDYNYRVKSAVNVLIVINIAVFIITNIFRGIPWFGLFGLVPEFVVKRLMLWQLLSYLFIHLGVWHLVINMLMLWMFGSVIESVWGSKRFLFYYFLTGIGAGCCSIIFAFNQGVPVVGASGAIFGLLVAYAVMFPDAVILLFFIFPMRMKYAAMVLAGINLLGALSNPGGSIAYIAHLGGGLIGYLYLQSETFKFKLNALNLSQIKNSGIAGNQVKKQTRQKDINREIDRILDKISAKGLESLTREEKRTLEKKSGKKSSREVD